MESRSWLELLVEFADDADEISRRYFRTADLRVDTKADDSPVSEADRAMSQGKLPLPAMSPSVSLVGSGTNYLMNPRSDSLRKRSTRFTSAIVPHSARTRSMAGSSRILD